METLLEYAQRKFPKTGRTRTDGTSGRTLLDVARNPSAPGSWNESARKSAEERLLRDRNGISRRSTETEHREEPEAPSAPQTVDLKKAIADEGMYQRAMDSADSESLRKYYQEQRDKARSVISGQGLQTGSSILAGGLEQSLGATAGFAGGIIREGEKSQNDNPEIAALQMMSGESSRDAGRQIGGQALSAEERAAADRENALERAGRELSERGALHVETQKYGKNAAQRFLIDLAVNAEQMALDSALAIPLGGSSLLPLFLRSAGGSYQEAMASGADSSRALSYGAAAGAVEVLTEKLSGGLDIVYGKGAADKATDYLIGKIAKSAAGRKAWGLLADAAGEGLEEVLSDLVNPLLQTIYNGKRYSGLGEYAEDLDPGEMAYDFLVGATLGFFGGAVNQAKGTDAETAFFQDASSYGLSFQQALSAWQTNVENGIITAPPGTQSVPDESLTGADLLLGVDSYSKRANTILRDPARLALFESVYGEAAGNSNTEKARYIAEALRSNNTLENQRAALEKTRQAAEEARQARAAQESAGQESTEQTNAAEAVMSPEESYVRGILMGEASYRAAGEILDNPAYRQAFERLTGKKLDGSRQENKRLIVDSRTAPGSAVDLSAPSQPNIDNTAAAAYNNSIENQQNGGISDGGSTGQLDGTTGEGLRGPGVRQEPDTGVQGERGYGRADLALSGIVRLSEDGGSESAGSTGQLDGTPGEGLRAGVRQEPDTGVQGERGYGRADLAFPGIVLLNEQARKSIESRGVVIAEAEATGDGAAFSSALDAARAADAQNGWAVTPKSAPELAESGALMLLGPNGAYGLAITPDGDIEAVFSNKAAGAPKLATMSLIPQAIANGGVKLDCYGERLAQLYSRYGFVPVARVAFNEAYANDGWTPDKGRPDIYFLMHNGDSPETVAANFNNYHKWTSDELNALPLFSGEDGYDKAFAYRDSLLQQERRSAGPALSEERGPGMERSGSEDMRRRMGDRLGAPEGTVNPLYYTPESVEQWDASAAQMLSRDFDGTVRRLQGSLNWSPEDQRAAKMILAKYAEDGDWDAYRRFDRVQAALGGTETARSLNARREGKTGSKALSRAAEAMESSKLPAETQNAVLGTVYDYSQRYDQACPQNGEINREGALQLIRDIMRERKVGFLSDSIADKVLGRDQRVSNFFDSVLNRQSDEYIANYAYAQLNAIANDYHSDVGSKAKSLQVIAQLLNIPTFMRNLTGNASFGAVDTFATGGMAHAIGNLVSKKTGFTNLNPMNKRFLSSAYRKGFLEALQVSLLEVGGGVTIKGDKYGVGNPFRANGGTLERIAYRLNQLTSYGLNTTDQMSRGASMAETIENLMQAGATEEQARQAAERLTEYQLFSNDSIAAKIAQGVHDTFNLAGIGGEVEGINRKGGIGLSELLGYNYAKVPTNLALKPIENSPLSTLLGTMQLINILRGNGKTVTTMAEDGSLVTKPLHTAEEQARAVRNIARGITGTGLIATFAALARAGLVGKADDDDDYDVTKARSSEGRNSTQWNLSATARVLASVFPGADEHPAEWKEGDILINMSSLEPLNAFMDIGYLWATNEFDEDDGFFDRVFEYGKDFLIGSIEAFMEMPLIQTLNDAYTDAKYADGEGKFGKVGSFIGSYFQNLISGFTPSTVKNIAKAADPYVRDTSADNWAEETGKEILSTIPFASRILEAKRDSFGEPVLRGTSAYNRIMNSLFRPNAVATYQKSELVTELDRLRESTGKSTFYPEYKAPNSFTHEGEKITLTAEEKREYQQAAGRAYAQMFSELMETDYYQGLSPEERTARISEIETWAGQLAKEGLMESRGKDYDGLSSRLEGMTAYRKADGSLDGWYKAYDKYREINGEEGLSATKKATDFASWLDSSGYSKYSRDILREQFRFYSTVGAEANKYDALYNAGLSPDTANAVYTSVAALKPAEGRSSVSAWQRYDAILRGGLSTEDLNRAMSVYMEDGSYRKWQRAMSEGYSPRAFVNYYRAYSTTEGDKNAAGKTVSGSKKRKVLNWAIVNGFTEREAQYLWDLFAKSS